MSPTDFSRPREGFSFKFRGIKLNSRPDTLAPDKYAVATNVRAYSDSSVQTRPGLVPLFDTGAPNLGTTDLRAYVSLGTDNLPRILARNADDTIWLDNGTQVGVLSGSGASRGAMFIPFRPNASPNPYMYIANGRDYQKFSAPDSLGNVVQQKVGIKEPPLAPEAYPSDFTLGPSLLYQTHGTPAFASGGNAGATALGARVTDTVVASFQDPNAASDALSHPVSLQVATTVSYQKFMMLKVGSSFARVVDVCPAIGQSIAISSIYYFSGGAGRCVLVPSVISSEPVGDASIYGTTRLNSLRRGSLIKIGTEVCLVWSVSFGPDGSICIETSTAFNHTTADTLSGIPAVVIMGGTGSFAAQAITSPDDTFAVTPAGIGTITATIASNPFIISGGGYQVDDYFHFSVNIDNLTNLIEFKLLLDVGDGTFTKDFYYYTVRPSDIQAAIANTQTQLSVSQTVAQRAVIDEENAAAAKNQGVTFSSAQTPPGTAQWAEIFIPISALTRVGNDQTRSLQTLGKLQFLFNVSGTLNCAVNSIYVTGGNQPDVGDIGAPYLYRIRGRSSVTGAVSNPSPAIRYGVNPRRSAVKVITPSGVPYDTQIDTWDIFRYGGAITSWRFVGSLPAGGGVGFNVFIDNFSDDAVSAGDVLDFDNFEPWPSVDVPFIQFQTDSPAGSGTAIRVNIPIATNVLRFLPGTLVQFPGISSGVFTLRSRPTLVSGTSYLFELEECVSGIGSGIQIQILEPDLANQHLPYMWGPDANGTVFAVGDSLRPGNLYFAKNNNPDSVPDSYNIEITPPTESLLGGEILDGLSFVASPEHWWALYPTPDNPMQRYNFVKQPWPRGLGAPFGHCNDGTQIFYWAKDGIASSKSGSLTDEDLYNLFPHEGVQGKSVTYNGVTIQAPDYAQAEKFRLSYANGFLYAVYPYIGGGGAYAMLVLNLRNMGWVPDTFLGSQNIFNVYKIEQEEESNSVINPVVLMAGTVSPVSGQGRIFQQQDLAPDNANFPISCIVGAFEFNGGDARAPKQWGDLFVDLQASATAGVHFMPMSLGAPLLGGDLIIPAASSRVRQPLSVGGVVVSDFMGLFATWQDDFTVQSKPTILYSWQPSFDIQPALEIGWTTFSSSFGLQGYGHIRQVAIAYVSTAPITLTLTTFDGLDPAPIVLPSTGGQYQKVMFPMRANKGQLFKFSAASSQTFQIFEDDCEIHIGQWGREGPYSILKNFGGVKDASAPI